MDGTNSAIDCAICCFSGYFYRPAMFVFTKLANDSDRARIRLYTDPYMPQARSLLYTFGCKFCLYESATPNAGSLLSLVDINAFKKKLVLLFVLQ